jgi:hypothetical protein
MLAAWVGSFALIAKSAAAAAPLVWEQTERSIAATPGQETATVTYAFRNNSDHPVRITSINTGCVCTSADLPKETYASGEKGELKIQFTMGDRVGRQERLIHLAIDDPTNPTAMLRLIVDIPELAVVRPRLLFWKTGEALDTKTAEIALTQPDQSQLSDPKSNNPTFTARLIAGARPGLYRLEIKPTSTADTVHGVIHIPAVFHGKARTLSVFVAVK